MVIANIMDIKPFRFGIQQSRCSRVVLSSPDRQIYYGKSFHTDVALSLAFQPFKGSIEYYGFKDLIFVCPYLYPQEGLFMEIVHFKILGNYSIEGSASLTYIVKKRDLIGL
jgi:hypothetical protein